MAHVHSVATTPTHHPCSAPASVAGDVDIGVGSPASPQARGGCGWASGSLSLPGSTRVSPLLREEDRVWQAAAGGNGGALAALPKEQVAARWAAGRGRSLGVLPGRWEGCRPVFKIIWLAAWLTQQKGRRRPCSPSCPGSDSTQPSPSLLPARSRRRNRGAGAADLFPPSQAVKALEELSPGAAGGVAQYMADGLTLRASMPEGGWLAGAHRAKARRHLDLHAGGCGRGTGRRARGVRCLLLHCALQPVSHSPWAQLVAVVPPCLRRRVARGAGAPAQRACGARAPVSTQRRGARWGRAAVSGAAPQHFPHPPASGGGAAVWRALTPAGDRVANRCFFEACVCDMSVCGSSSVAVRLGRRDVSG